VLFTDRAWETEGRSTVEKPEKSIKGTFDIFAADVYKPVASLLLRRDLTNRRSTFVIKDMQKTYMNTDTAKDKSLFISNVSVLLSY